MLTPSISAQRRLLPITKICHSFVIGSQHKRAAAASVSD